MALQSSNNILILWRLKSDWDKERGRREWRVVVKGARFIKKLTEQELRRGGGL